MKARRGEVSRLGLLLCLLAVVTLFPILLTLGGGPFSACIVAICIAAVSLFWPLVILADFLPWGLWLLPWAVFGIACVLQLIGRKKNVSDVVIPAYRITSAMIAALILFLI